jgi:hypothetical protein
MLLLLSVARGEDTPLRFEGGCRVALSGQPAYRAHCLVEDLKSPGYNNRFRLVVHAPRPGVGVTDAADLVRAEALPNGRMRWLSPLIGSVEISPRSDTVREVLRRAAPAWEVRPQRIRLRRIDEGLEILIEEPYGDFYGHYTTESEGTPARPASPTARWLVDWIHSLRALSNVK